MLSRIIGFSDESRRKARELTRKVAQGLLEVESVNDLLYRLPKSACCRTVAITIWILSSINNTVSNLEGTETFREAIYYKHERAST
jgi:hypothetical protein